MTILDKIRGWFRTQPTPSKRPLRLGGRRSRQSSDFSNEMPFISSFFIESPETPLDSWRTLELNDQTLARISTERLMELLPDISPEVDRAIWDFLRLCNPGSEVNVFQVDSEEEHRQGTAYVKEILSTLGRYYGALDVVYNRLFFGVFIRGGFLAELVLDENGRDFVDLATPDPAAIRFRKVTDERRGVIWELGQYQGSTWVTFDEFVKYVPLDPRPGKPYGRAIITSAIGVALFMIGLLHDLRRVVAQQGYPRLDLEVRLEQLREAMPENLEDDPGTFEAWVNDIVDEISTVYSTLEPDDAYVHTDVVQVNRPVGAIGADSLGAVDGLIRALERMITRALKSMPLLMGSNEATSEAHANRQWEIHMAGIRSVQHLCEQLLEQMLEMALQAQGIVADVQFRFAELRASERLRDAQAEAMEIANARAKYDHGWASQNEVAIEITGHEADEDAPRVAAGAVEMVQGDGDGLEVVRARNGQG